MGRRGRGTVVVVFVAVLGAVSVWSAYFLMVMPSFKHQPTECLSDSVGEAFRRESCGRFATMQAALTGVVLVVAVGALWVGVRRLRDLVDDLMARRRARAVDAAT